MNHNVIMVLLVSAMFIFVLTLTTFMCCVCEVVLFKHVNCIWLRKVLRREMVQFRTSRELYFPKNKIVFSIKIMFCSPVLPAVALFIVKMLLSVGFNLLIMVVIESCRAFIENSIVKRHVSLCVGSMNCCFAHFTLHSNTIVSWCSEARSSVNISRK